MAYFKLKRNCDKKHLLFSDHSESEIRYIFAYADFAARFFKNI
jgi:hypothetical protein